MSKDKIDKSRVRQLIASITIFKKLQNHEGLIDFIAQQNISKIKQGTSLFKEGEMANDVCILLDGKVEVKRKSLSGDNFVVAVITASLKKHRYTLLGERSLCTMATRSATIICVSDLHVLRITKAKFFSLCESYPEVGLNVYKEICDILQERLYVANRNVIELFNAFVDEITSKDEIGHYSSMISNLSQIDHIDI